MARLDQTFKIAIIALLVACHPTENKEITFKEISGTAVLIGDQIVKLDEHLNMVSRDKEGAIVTLKGLSENLFQNTDDYCDAFKYVKIASSAGDRIVDGRNVYQIVNSDQNASFTYRNNEYELKATSFFGIGVSDDEGLTFCEKYHTPVVLIDKSANNPRLVQLINTAISNEPTGKKEFKYFELIENDMAYDSIEKVDVVENGVILTVKRELQEGWNRFQVKLLLDEKEYRAEYLNQGNTIDLGQP